MSMNFKVENKYLDITNYPSVERYLESMARKGWLIHKIFVGNIFIFKKIKPQELEFSISPYEIETAFTRKSKKELDEFKDVTKSVGWNYCTKSYNLHIYYKEKHGEALDIHTDEEEEFKLLEKLGKTQLRGCYFIIPFLLFISWVNIGRMTSGVYPMKDGLNQIIIPLLPIALVLTTTQLIHTKKFLKRNKENIELGKDLEYSNSKYYMIRIIFPIFYLVIVAFVFYILYVSIIFKNKIILFALLPLTGVIVGQLYRIFIKPSKHSKRFKIVVFGITILAVVMISSGVGIIGIVNINGLGNGSNTLNREKYRVLLTSDFIETTEEAERTLLENTSFLVPRSYEHISRGSYTDEISHLETEYSKALTEGIANELMNRYKEEAVKNIGRNYSPDLEYSYELGRVDGILLDRGLTISDFNELKQEDLKYAISESIKRMKTRTIAKADHILWNVDEAYFLTCEQDTIILRKGKEVFFLRGIDFSDVEIITIAKEKLKL